MDGHTHSLSDTARRSNVRLLIHTEAGVRTRGRYCKFFHQWLHALFSAGSRDRQRAPLGLRIEDLQGREVLALEVGGPLIVVELPAGTYHINAHRGNVRRGYTMTLKHDQPFDLYLNLALAPK